MKRTQHFVMLWCIALLAGPAWADEPPNPNELSYTSPSGARWTVTAEGISAIHLGDRQIADGGWRLEAGHHWYAGPEVDPAAGDVESSEIEVVSDRVAKVRHVQGAITIVYTYTFTGEDLEIKAWVENHHATAPLEIVHFSGLSVDFGRPPTGWTPLWHPSYTRANPGSAWLRTTAASVRAGASATGSAWACRPATLSSIAP